MCTAQDISTSKLPPLLRFELTKITRKACIFLVRRASATTLLKKRSVLFTSSSVPIPWKVREDGLVKKGRRTLTTAQFWAGDIMLDLHLVEVPRGARVPENFKRKPCLRSPAADLDRDIR